MAEPSSRPRLLFAVTEDWYFYSHRRPMIRAAQECGFEVCAVTNAGACRAAIEALGVRVIPFSFERRSLNPLKALKQTADLAAIYRAERPAIVHHIAMKPVLIGSLAAWIAGVPRTINAFAGLGYLFSARTLLATLLRIALIPPFFLLLRRRGSRLLLQNADDFSTLRRMGLADSRRCTVIRGSGVDPGAYPQKPLPGTDDGFFCVYAGRMIGIKGLDTLKEAFALLEQEAPRARLLLYGSPDPANPGSWTRERIDDWVRHSGNVLYKGQSDDMAGVWAGAHLALQASWGGEGIPKSLLEAASCGRPIVASDVPGCRETVRNGENGFLVPPRDARALADSIALLAADPGLCRAMGARSRTLIAESGLSADSVTAATAALYRQCMAEIVDKSAASHVDKPGLRRGAD